MQAPTTRTKRPLGRRIQQRVFRVVNVPMRNMLGLPFATPLSRNLMLLYLTGRRTGKSYRQPVSYVRDGAALLTPGGGNWKHNLSEGKPVHIRLRGRDVTARPEIVADPEEVERLLGIMLTANPTAGRFVRIPKGSDGRLDPDRLAAALRYGFRIIRWHLSLVEHVSVHGKGRGARSEGRGARSRMTTPAGPPTVTELLLAQGSSSRPGLLFEDRQWSWQEHVRECARYAAALRARHERERERDPGRPFHVGVLADNVPEFSFLLGGCAFAGAVLVALNPVRRGAALARDVARTDCQYVLAEPHYRELLSEAEVPVLPLDQLSDTADPELDAATVANATPDDLLMLIFTSGTSGEPKAVRCTHGKIAIPGRMLADRFALTKDDTVYVSMPMFHSNAVMAGWAVGLAAGAAIALRRRFSASKFIDDIRAFNATYANYVGKPLSYVLATPARDDDKDNPLRIAYGNEGAPGDLARFAKRFGCQVVDGFGSSEGGVSISRDPDTPPGALGRLIDGVAVLNPETGRPCQPARFDAAGRLLNPDEAVGEFVNTIGPGLFAGYYGDPAADASRMRDGMYWSGDLGYADDRGFCWFAGRTSEWLRVDGENLGTAPIERVLRRHPAIAEAAVYGVPDPVAGDQIMACIVLRGGATLTPAELGIFLAAQTDLGPKQHPRFVRVATGLPRTATFKALTRVLATEGLDTSDPVWRV